MCLELKICPCFEYAKIYDSYGHENEISNTSIINKLTTKLKSWKYSLTKSKHFFIFMCKYKSVLILKIKIFNLTLVIPIFTGPRLPRYAREFLSQLTFLCFYAFNFLLDIDFTYVCGTPKRAILINASTQTKKFAKLDTIFCLMYNLKKEVNKKLRVSFTFLDFKPWTDIQLKVHWW